MPCFTKQFSGKAGAIVTEAMILDSVKVAEGQPMPKFRFTDKAAWDTGSEVTVISQEIVDSLGLQPTGKSGIQGIGGIQIIYTYTIQIGLPNGDAIRNVNAYCYDLEDYDVLIGMDVITQTDFLITNKENTVFSFRYPSEGNVELKE